MRTWWENLAHRERWLLGGGLGLSLLLLGYGALWEPWHARHQRLQNMVLEQRAALTWMRQAAQQLSGTTAKPSVATQDSLLTRVDATARAAGLGAALQQITALGEKQLSVRFEHVGFAALLAWLHSLENSHAVLLQQVNVERTARSGRVHAKIIFEDAR